ncbi:pentapeptide repeat-containing protein [Allonocardiopsis opalescens]|uniref:Pentapeptide repeat protein n=1 Tax=Allonocardiopsis opalescens TaxID=1144618 RepID=A0A2T0PUW1_9ACTN|nr:pentapeptide repeat-containing protein [Allonocardiopsis opalescens]PRX92516.1 pentapeptide repeat protein [Allonocardiopsis opalescens]
MAERTSAALAWTGGAALCAVLAAAVLAAFGPLPGLVLDATPGAGELAAAERVAAEGDIRNSLLQAVAGLLLVIGAVTAWRQYLVARRQHLLSRHIAVTDAFARAVEQLGSAESAAVRLGGVYALDRVADDDPAERTRVAEILTAFVREHATDGEPPPREAVAALSVLVRRDWPGRLDLDAVALPGARLARARLRGASLRGADLSGADLHGAVLAGAALDGADLRRAELSGADLSGAGLDGARLSAATADSATRWPAGFAPADHGVALG